MLRSFTIIFLYIAALQTYSQQDSSKLLEDVVVSGNRFETSKKESIIPISLLNREVLQAQQSIGLAEGLAFQSGLRVENNCQNCGFTQLRMNGLDGVYSQILINNRPLFSALTQVYGLELIPASAIERVEIIKGGGSALYGGNAIGGTLNIITRMPTENATEISTYTGLVGGQSWEQYYNFNNSLISNDKKKGLLLYGGLRDREALDIDGDGFTELAQLKNKHLGMQAFWELNRQNLLRVDAMALQEYRRGGDRLNIAPNLVDIAEQLEHDLIQFGLQHDFTSKNKKIKINNYLSGMYTLRDSYYGGLGGGRTAEDTAAAADAFGYTTDLSLIGGSAVNFRVKNRAMLTVGAEFLINRLDDEISGYNKKTMQSVNTLSGYAQYEYNMNDKWSLLGGLRLDYVQIKGEYSIDTEFREQDLALPVLSPRATLKYKLSSDQSLRLSYARGFRAPQIFNEDLHVDMAAGEPRFSILAENVQVEMSDAFTATWDYDFKIMGKNSQLLIEGFYTELYNPFVNVTTDIELLNGSILEEVRNGGAAYVSGVNLEISQNISPALQWQAGFTFQVARFREEQEIYEDEENPENSLFISNFVRTPNDYGYLKIKYLASPKNIIELTAQYTGSMDIARVINEEDELIELVNTQSFMDVHLRYTRQIWQKQKSKLEIYGGIINIFNSFQREFDQGPERDAAFLFGPLRPRTFYAGLNLKF